MQTKRGPTTWKRPSMAVLAVLVAVGMSLGLARAADTSDIGFVDQAALASVKSFADANRQLAAYKAQLDRQFASQVRAKRNPADQQKLAGDFQRKLADRQRALFGPLFAKAQVAIASVASSNNLSVIVDRRIIIAGGQDVTRKVLDLLSGAGDPVPPASTPPPSSVGYVDQTQIDQIAKIRTANEEFQKFRDGQLSAAQTKLKGAKSDGDRQAILRDYQKTLADKQKATIDPLVDQTRSAISSVARKKGLILVIDRGNLIYGGTDITSDVTSILK